MGILIAGVHCLDARGMTIAPEVLIPFATGMMVGYAMLNSVPSVLLAAPDESALFTVLPGQKYVMEGRGYEGVMITALGGVVGTVSLLLLLGVLGPRYLPVAKTVFRRHTHWILWCVICFMLMSEWPKGGTTGQAGWARFLEGWRSTGAGLLTFLLSGLLGFVLIYRPPTPAQAGFQNLMPAFVGLFTVPWLILNIASGVKIPPQRMTWATGVNSAVVLRGGLAGTLGGAFAAFFPAVTGGVGGFLAGQATGVRDDRVFLVSQGASKLVYYAGAFLLFFVPGLHMTRGGGAWMLKGLYAPHGYHDYYMVLASLAISCSICFFMVRPLVRAIIALMNRYGYRLISCVALGVVLVIVLGLTRWTGLYVALVGAGIGLIPVLFGSRRMNCLGVILLPIACNMSGVGAVVAGWLRLL